LLLVAALVPLLTGCNVWEQLGRSPDASRFNPDEATITPANVASLSDAWSSQVNGTFSEPILSGGKLYTTVVSGTSSVVRAYDAATGAVLWERPGSGPVVLAQGALWVSTGFSCDSLLTRLDPATGDVLTTESPGADKVGPVVASGSTVAFVTRTGCSQTGNRAQLVVRDPSRAPGRWTFSFPDGVSPRPPSIGHGKIYVAADDQVYAFDLAGCGAPTCASVWTTSLDLDGERVVASDKRPVVGPDGTVYVGATLGLQTLVRALDGESGAHLWRTDLQPAPGFGWQWLALAHGQLYVSDHRNDGSGPLLAVFAAGGCAQPVCPPVWTAALDGLPVAGMTIGGDVLYVGLFRPSGDALLAFPARGCGSAVCPRLADIGFGDRQPLQVAVADGRVAVAASGPGGAILRVLVPAS
jgi:hypothetical protein